MTNNSDNSVVLIGVGEMGGVFARGFLRKGHPVIPVTRDQDMNQLASEVTTPLAVIVAVGEKDLQDTLAQIPDNWREQIILLQNELLPNDWQQHGLDSATVISVWFEKKKGQDVKVIVPSPAYGPQASLLEAALGTINIPVRVLDTPNDLLFELVLKNLYIVTTNVCGLKVGGNVGQLWQKHEEFARSVAYEVLSIQEYLTQQEFPRNLMIDSMLACFNGDLDHKCMGRSAPARLQRALAQAAEAGIEVPTMAGLSNLAA